MLWLSKNVGMTGCREQFPCQLTYAFFRMKFHRIRWIFSIAILIVGKLSCDMFGLKRERVGVELVNTQQTFVSNLPFQPGVWCQPCQWEFVLSLAWVDQYVEGDQGICKGIGTPCLGMIQQAGFRNVQLIAYNSLWHICSVTSPNVCSIYNKFLRSASNRRINMAAAAA